MCVCVCVFVCVYVCIYIAVNIKIDIYATCTTSVFLCFTASLRRRRSAPWGAHHESMTIVIWIDL